MFGVMKNVLIGIAVVVGLVGCSWWESEPRYRFERDVEKLKALPYAKVIWENRHILPFEPRTIFDTPVNKVLLAFPDPTSFLSGDVQFRVTLAGFERKSESWIAEVDCDTRTALWHPFDEDGISRQSDVDVDLDPDEHRVFCEQDWSAAEEELRRSLLQGPSN